MRLLFFVVIFVLTFSSVVKEADADRYKTMQEIKQTMCPVVKGVLCVIAFGNSELNDMADTQNEIGTPIINADINTPILSDVNTPSLSDETDEFTREINLKAY